MEGCGWEAPEERERSGPQLLNSPKETNKWIVIQSPSTIPVYPTALSKVLCPGSLEQVCSVVFLIRPFRSFCCSTLFLDRPPFYCTPHEPVDRICHNKRMLNSGVWPAECDDHINSQRS